MLLHERAICLAYPQVVGIPDWQTGAREMMQINGLTPLWLPPSDSDKTEFSASASSRSFIRNCLRGEVGTSEAECELVHTCCSFFCGVGSPANATSRLPAIEPTSLRGTSRRADR